MLLDPAPRAVWTHILSLMNHHAYCWYHFSCDEPQLLAWVTQDRSERMMWTLETPSPGRTDHFTPPPVPQWSFLRSHMGFTQAAEESEKCSGQGWNSPICALMLCWMMWCPAAIPRVQSGRKSQPTVWDTALHLALDLLGVDCSYWGEKVWMILRLTWDKQIFETFWYLLACYFMVEKPKI